MAASKKPSAPPDKVEAYQRLVATMPEVECKGATHPYTSFNGHMFSYLHPSGAMALRLPEDVRAEFLKKYKSKLFEAYGIVQKEYVTVPDQLLKNTKELRPYFAASFRYVSGLQPKK